MLFNNTSAMLFKRLDCIIMQNRKIILLLERSKGFQSPIKNKHYHSIDEFMEEVISDFSQYDSVDKSMYNAKASQQNIINSTGTSAKTEAQLQDILVRITELNNTVDCRINRMKKLENSWHSHEKITTHTHPIHHADV